jgi:hypothetical protein
MSESPIPLDLQNFILRHIDSIGQIEALLLLRRHVNEDWTVNSVAQRLYISDPETEETLANLCADGLITCTDGIFRYTGASPELDRMVGRLSDAYRTNLVGVTNIVHAKPRRIRAFANAFKMRRDRG